MMDWTNIILTIIAAAIGAYFAKKLKIPASYMLGSMIGVAIFNVATGKAFMPSEIKFFTQAISGAYIGVSLKRKDLGTLTSLAIPVVILTVIYMGFTFLIGHLFNMVFSIDFPTALLMAVPGGVTDTTLMAYELGANPALVSFMQSLRLISAYMVFPTLIPKVAKLDNEPIEIKNTLKLSDKYVLDKIVPDSFLPQHLVVISVGLIGGYIGKISGLPAGTLSVSMLFVMIFNVNCSKIKLDKRFKNFVQLFAGSLVGSTITIDIFLNLRTLFIPAALLILGYVVIVFIISWCIWKTKKVDLVSAMFASCPGGASDMALVASDLGGDSPKIAIIQVARLISCYVVFPLWVKFLISIN